jgi:hypothetical protein
MIRRYTTATQPTYTARSRLQQRRNKTAGIRTLNLARTANSD